MSKITRRGFLAGLTTTAIIPLLPATAKPAIIPNPRPYQRQILKSLEQGIHYGKITSVRHVSPNALDIVIECRDNIKIYEKMIAKHVKDKG